MFTGIIEERGTIENITPDQSGYRMRIAAPRIAAELQADDSVAVNGICLTVTAIRGNTFSVDAVKESAERTTLKDWRSGLEVNLERGMPANGRFDGHLVQGHVDGIARLLKKEKQGKSVVMTFKASEKLTALMVEKGSIALDGVSLTLTRVGRTDFSVALIPYSLGHTTLDALSVGDSVNVETDIIGKYIMKYTSSKNDLNEEALKKWGYKW
jgi:riboflavin synthase